MADNEEREEEEFHESVTGDEPEDDPDKEPSMHSSEDHVHCGNPDQRRTTHNQEPGPSNQGAGTSGTGNNTHSTANDNGPGGSANNNAGPNGPTNGNNNGPGGPANDNAGSNGPTNGNTNGNQNNTGTNGANNRNNNPGGPNNAHSNEPGGSANNNAGPSGPSNSNNQRPGFSANPNAGANGQSNQNQGNNQDGDQDRRYQYQGGYDHQQGPPPQQENPPSYIAQVQGLLELRARGLLTDISLQNQIAALSGGGPPTPATPTVINLPDLTRPFSMIAEQLQQNNANHSRGGKPVDYGKHIEKFTGLEGQVKAMKWIYNLQLAKDCSTYPEKDFLVNLVQLMESNSMAASWHETCARHAESWVQWKALFEKEYGYSEDELYEKEQQFNDLQQKSTEGFAAYSRAKVTLNSSLGLNYPNNMLVKKIYDRMSAQFKNFVGKPTAQTTLLELQDRMKEVETHDVLTKLQKTGKNATEYAHVRTVEQYYAFIGQTPANQNTVNTNVQKSNQNPNSDNKSKKSNNKPGTPAAQSQQTPATVAPKTQSVSTPGVNSTTGASPKTHLQSASQPTPGSIAANNLPDEGTNSTGFVGDPALVKWYKSFRKCELCGLKGFNKFLCPYCLTIPEINENRANFKEKREAQKATETANQNASDAQPEVNLQVNMISTPQYSTSENANRGAQ
jgi:hypothetical protein